MAEIFILNRMNMRSDQLDQQEQSLVGQIMGAPDVVETVLEWEAIIEPVGAKKGMKRPVVVEYASRLYGRRVCERHNYMHGPDSKAWGGEMDRTYTLGKL